MLEKDFVCGWRDISGERWSGVSGRYESDEGAVWTTNGAGPHNIQLFVLAPDGTVLHCLPGYWESHDLAHELAFAKSLLRVWQDESLSRAQKDAKFKSMNLGHLKDHSREMVTRSEMQGFDKKFEAKRESRSDCILREDSIQPRFRPRKDDRFKTTDQIVHERMAARPFVPYSEFDVEAYTDYGRQKYDKKQAHFADLLPRGGVGFRDKVLDLVPKAKPGGLREHLADAVRKKNDAAAAKGADGSEKDQRKAERRAKVRALLEEALRGRRERATASKSSGD
jgi:hypothetical protein